MPDAAQSDLPAPVRGHLADQAQDSYRAACNRAYSDYESEPRQEESAHRVAWAAVKKLYVKADGDWVARGP